MSDESTDPANGRCRYCGSPYPDHAEDCVRPVEHFAFDDASPRPGEDVPTSADAIKAALEAFDREAASCPFGPAHRRSPPVDKPCPKCSATRKEGCRVMTCAAFGFLAIVRHAIETEPA